MKEQKTGIISSITLTRNGAGEITYATKNVPLLPSLTDGAKTYAYNGAGEVSGYVYDKMGRLTADGNRTYTWDLASRLTSYTDGGSTTSFTYDGLGMRVTRTTGGATRSYVFNYALGLPSISVVRQGGVDLRYYVHLPGGRLLYSAEAADNSRRFYHFDEMGTTLFLTGESGTVTDSYGITPYGEMTAKTGTTDNSFTFIGAYGVMQEGDTGLYHMKFRYYDSITSRFISRDPVKSIHPKQMNPYQYASENPLRYLDPMGLNSELNRMNDRIEYLEKWFKDGGAYGAGSIGEKLNESYREELQELRKKRKAHRDSVRAKFIKLFDSVHAKLIKRLYNLPPKYDFVPEDAFPGKDTVFIKHFILPGLGISLESFFDLNDKPEDRKYETDFLPIPATPDFPIPEGDGGDPTDWMGYVSEKVL